jgi:hypothetical protein
MGVSEGAGSPPVPVQDADGVGVNDERGPAAGVEQHAVGGLRANAMNGKQPVSGLVHGARPQILPATAAFVEKKPEKGAEPSGFHAGASGRPNQIGELGFFKAEQAGRSQKSLCAEAVDSQFDLSPIGVLDEDRANADFQRAVAGPPALMAEMCQQELIGAA